MDFDISDLLDVEVHFHQVFQGNVLEDIDLFDVMTANLTNSKLWVLFFHCVTVKVATAAFSYNITPMITNHLGNSTVSHNF